MGSPGSARFIKRNNILKKKCELEREHLVGKVLAPAYGSLKICI